jgi:hypothetical protein
MMIVRSKLMFAHVSKQAQSRLKHCMEHYPVVSNSVLCLNLFVAGDLCAQYSEYKYLHNHDDDNEGNADDNSAESSHTGTDRWNVQRTAQCAAYGAAVTGPLLATWYPFIEKVCIKYSVTARYGSWGAPILKVLADEFILEPPCLFAFFFWMNLCEGGDRKSLQDQLQTQFLPSWMASLAVWPMVLLGTFRFAPVYAQAPIISACNIVWDGFLSYRNTLSSAEKTQKLEARNSSNGQHTINC